MLGGQQRSNNVPYPPFRRYIVFWRKRPEKQRTSFRRSAHPLHHRFHHPASYTIYRKMQALEKALHQPMPFTTGGQTINDRLTAAKHALAGSQLGKTICKATTEELMAPKKKHCDYLLHCTNEPNVSIPSMANLLIERTQNPNWIVVYKALITIHNLMCYGNERFSQYLASCNTTFNLTSFVDRTGLQGTGAALAAGYDMSTHVRRYAKYISEKIHTYRLCAFDFCKVKRGREDGLLRAMHTDKLLKTLPILQNQIDALLEFQVTSSELNNGVINCCFILLFRDLIRLFACYNDGIINLLEKFFDMNKRQCREALDMYKGFLYRLDKVSDFLRVAESVGIDRGEIPDLTRAPASLLEALEAHLYHLEGGRGPPPSVTSAQQMISTYQLQSHQPVDAYSGGGGPINYGGNNPFGGVDELAKQRYLEEEKQRLMQYEEQRRQQGPQQSSSGDICRSPPPPSTNPFSSGSGGGSGGNPDLLSFLEAPAATSQSNPFAFAQPTAQPAGTGPAPPQFNPFSSTSLGGGNGPPMQSVSQPAPSYGGSQPNPFGAPTSGGMYPSVQQQPGFPSTGIGNTPLPLNPMTMYGQQPPSNSQWGPPGGGGGYVAPPHPWNAFGGQPHQSVVYGQPTMGYGMGQQQNQFGGAQTGAKGAFGSFS